MLGDAARISRSVEEWDRRLTSTEPADFDALSEAIDVLYARAGHAPPQIIVRAASMEAGLQRAIECSSAGMQLPEPLRHLLSASWWEWRKALTFDVQERIDEVGDRLRFVSRTHWQLRPVVNGSEAGGRDLALERESVPRRAPWNDRGLGAGDGPDVAETAFARDIGIIVDEQILEAATMLCGGAAWWAFEGTAILTDRPAVWRRDQGGRLHAHDGPAWRTRDGNERWAWHGVLVPAELIAEPASIDLDWLRAQRFEVRCAALDRVGWETSLDRFRARHVSSDEWGDLYRVAGTLIVRVTNSTPETDGTFVDHFLIVHPACRPMLNDFGTLGDPQPLTPLNAIASTFGLCGAEYAKIQAMT